MNEVVPIEPKVSRADMRVVMDRIAVFDTAQFEHMQRVATLMATCSLVPDALKNKVADCFLVVNQARNWNMDPFSVAQCTSIVKGKLCFEGKLVAAAIASDPGLVGPLNYEFDGEGDNRTVTVIGRLKGETKDRTVNGTVKAWRTNNDQWKNDPDQMLVYRGSRQWARRHKPDRLLGVYAPDEFDDDAGEKWPRRAPRDVTPSAAPPPAPPPSVSAPVVPPSPPVAPAIEETSFVETEPSEPPKSYDDMIADWAARLTDADRTVQEDIFETEIDPAHEQGIIFPPDWNKLTALVKDA